MDVDTTNSTMSAYGKTYVVAQKVIAKGGLLLFLNATDCR